MLMMPGGDSGNMIMGDMFLRGFVTLIDIANERAGFAPSTALRGAAGGPGDPARVPQAARAGAAGRRACREAASATRCSSAAVTSEAPAARASSPSSQRDRAASTDRRTTPGRDSRPAALAARRVAPISNSTWRKWIRPVIEDRAGGARVPVPRPADAAGVDEVAGLGRRARSSRSLGHDVMWPRRQACTIGRWVCPNQHSRSAPPASASRFAAIRCGDEMWSWIVGGRRQRTVDEAGRRIEHCEPRQPAQIGRLRGVELAAAIQDAIARRAMNGNARGSSVPAAARSWLPARTTSHRSRTRATHSLGRA